MSYQRNVSVKSIPLPIETVYCSEVDTILRNRKTVEGNKFNCFGVENFNRIYCKSPPEWKMSRIGAKTIGVCNMTIHWKDDDFQFIWYVRKYKHIIQRSKDYVANQVAINDIYNYTLNYNMKIFSIPINIRISSNDTWEAIKCKIMNVINQENLSWFYVNTICLVTY